MIDIDAFKKDVEASGSKYIRYTNIHLHRGWYASAIENKKIEVKEMKKQEEDLTYDEYGNIVNNPPFDVVEKEVTIIRMLPSLYPIPNNEVTNLDIKEDLYITFGNALHEVKGYSFTKNYLELKI